MRRTLSGRYQIDFDWGYFEKMRPDWESAYPALKGLPVSRAWAASIDYTPDHLPIIDEPMEGFYVLAAGGHGMMWGPALGEKMARLISEGALSGVPKEDVELARFSRGEGSRQGGGHDRPSLPEEMKGDEACDCAGATDLPDDPRSRCGC